jgi:hypothetical protein
VDHAARFRANALTALRDHWGEVYEIGWDEEFVADSRDGRVSIFAPTAEALLEAMRLDYLIRCNPLS